MVNKTKRNALIGASLFSISTASGLTIAAPMAYAAAEAAAPAEDLGELQEIVVTARKRSEDVLKTPVAVSVLTSDAIAQRGVVSVNDIADQTPGMNVTNNAAGRSDRSFQQMVIRGFAPAIVDITTVATFIDGVPVSSASALTTISDPERVEVLKGPQSAYFGRNTFAGAFNVVNKVPTDEFHGSASVMVGTRDNYRMSAALEGPIVGDKLTFRVTGDRFSKSGSYENASNPSQTLGDQSTTSGTLMLVFKPIEGLTIKAFGLLSKDDDGPSAQGLISAYTVTNAAGKVVVPGQSNCKLNGNPTFCGTAPSLASGTPSASTLTDGYIKNFLSLPNGRFLSPSDGTQGYGLVRHFYHGHLAADYEIPDTDLTVSYLLGVNSETYSALVDLDNYGDTSIPNNGFGSIPAGARSYFDYPYLVERKTDDYSQELRLAYDSGPLRVTSGVNFIDAWSQSGNGGGNGALGKTAFFSANGETRSRTSSAFYGITYQVTDALSLSAEGRYQIDKLFAYAPLTGYTATNSAFVPAGYYPGGSLMLSKSYENFMPRFIAQYQLNDDLMTYASYAKGVNPGRFNTSFISSSAATQRAAAAAGLKVQVDPEEVTNYEIGLKGRLFDGRLRFTLDGYYAQWRNQINSLNLSGIDPVSNSAFSITSYDNTGNVDLKGIEFDGTYALTKRIALNLGAALVDTDIQSYRSTAITKLTGITDFSGKEMPNTSKYSANAGLQYNGDLKGWTDGTWFARADYIYKSGVWSNAADIVKTPDRHTVNVRLGATQGDISADVFVNNLFDNTTPTSISDQFIFTNNFAYTSTLSALVVGLPERRTFGLQVRYKF
ncbi:TonB-dependent receptor [Nitrospirillum sp. BR 11828]|uniref:TonB-dependent receptor n=1 Tax=Nitrospirillum sp. BR 11828 TaxID=3104325 RepID=UPI002ACACA4D|nr:TonB-dependent receptor [Nitrospirillum sp. BR 11828]MDZ5648253.1 TonB-dependent receptor [Nitrospirillum sp. BR 11828]